MKLKYYLRGLGIGIAVTAFLMGAVPGGKETLSDAQIKERAAQLGMVEESSRTLSQVNTASSQDSSGEEFWEENLGEQETETPGQQPIERPSKDKEQEPETKPKEQSAEEAAQASQAEGQTFVSDGDTSVSDKTAEAVLITVDRGDSSESVSRSLEEAGLVEDAGSFDQYLCSNGYAKRICVGTYKIPVGTSEKEIAEIITRKP